ncbi:MAG: RND transporter [Gammaproteobacteria bacterium]|nr:RND transporter [Gammaproteobacteria bacterium]
MKWLDSISLLWLTLLCSVLILAPFFPEPHLWQQLKLLGSGELNQTADIVDLLLHAAPLLLIAWKIVRIVRQRRRAA